MGGHDVVAEAGADDKVRLRQLLLQQPTGPQQTSELLVVSEVQLDAAFQLRSERF